MIKGVVVPQFKDILEILLVLLSLSAMALFYYQRHIQEFFYTEISLVMITIISTILFLYLIISDKQSRKT
ncbi:MAG: hypothetical protein AMQ74_01891 [Candidatus Methanofastidiosum methylothiophilum]|uniref:Uncharacterized protein n=1 Tax=Candidatus Methanofastidiosum methylothiophilum TaxID=1705564 RepID=A0A150IKW5_9EURY|nr:MAG: hypothetical protein AMQ74_01891 [Candidatus Methanofastidiosum methylthiophilus]